MGDLLYEHVYIIIWDVICNIHRIWCPWFRLITQYGLLGLLSYSKTTWRSQDFHVDQWSQSIIYLRTLYHGWWRHVDRLDIYDGIIGCLFDYHWLSLHLQCQSLIFQYGPVILVNVVRLLERADLCVTLQACPSSKNETNIVYPPSPAPVFQLFEDL